MMQFATRIINNFFLFLSIFFNCTICMYLIVFIFIICKNIILTFSFFSNFILMFFLEYFIIKLILHIQKFNWIFFIHNWFGFISMVSGAKANWYLFHPERPVDTRQGSSPSLTCKFWFQILNRLSIKNKFVLVKQLQKIVGGNLEAGIFSKFLSAMKEFKNNFIGV